MSTIVQNREWALFNAIPQPTLVLLPDKPRYTIVYVNEAYIKVTKSRRIDFLSHGIFEAFPENPEDPENTGVTNARTSLDTVMATFAPHIMEIQKYDIPLRDSSAFEEKFWRAENIPVFNKEGDMEFILHAVTDVTHKILQKKAEEEKQKAEQERNESYHRLYSILESIGDAYFVVDEHWKVVYWNKVAEEVLGVKESEALDEILWKVFPTDGDEKNYRNFKKVKDSQEAESFEICYKPAGKWFDVSAYPCDNGIAVFLRDVSERKKSEFEKERLLRDLVTSNDELRQFSFIVSHNLMEPVTTLQSLIEMGERHPVANEALRDFVCDFKSSVTKLRSTIDDLINVLIIKNQSLPVKQKSLNFEEIFQKILDQAGDFIGKCKPHIEIDFKDASSVVFNEVYLENIFMNLLINAVQFRSPLRPLEIKVSTRDMNDHILLEFRDNGLGIDMVQHKDRLFGLYQTFHDLPESKGLGLFIVKSQIEVMGGSIYAISDVDQGMAILIQFKKKENAI